MRMKTLATVLLSCVMAMPVYGSKSVFKALRAVMKLSSTQIAAIGQLDAMQRGAIRQLNADRRLDNVSTFSGGNTNVLL